MLRAAALALRARLRELRSLREICLIAQPPFFSKEGNTTFFTMFPVGQ